MNPFTSVRPRGADAPAKAPKVRKQPTNVTFKGTTRVLNAAGKWQAKLDPDASRSIVIESRMESQASTDKRRAITRGLS